MAHDETFTDNKERTIDFDVQPEIIKAYHKGKRIGEFTLRIEEMPLVGEEVHADAINIDGDFQRAGIGLAMVRLAFVNSGAPIIPPDTYYPEKENRNSMTQGGRALMRAAQKLGYVSGFRDQEDV
jgi:hypothetical protein